ncbi:nucleoside-diphosphate-sugar epimerase [Catenulispora sp. GP43]|uniref:NAD-dependent epimerase/dehydratase family protein n=1 Tax=Catenulispora sp. GP43 TaxID=3156263 RepID=UPI0035130C83
MSVHVIVGAGPVGTATATLLADRGDRVRVITRRGTGPDRPGVERIAADASDAAALAEACAGATALYNCANPPYNRWPIDWPPLAAAFLHAARTSGAVLITTGNLYVYGPPTGPMTEQHPLRPAGTKAGVRARMWEEALAAHEAGDLRTAEIRSSDYLGAGTQTLFSVGVMPKVLAGKRAAAPADPDAPHTWTYAGDVARMLVAVAGDEHAWGRAWHTPSPEPASLRDLATLAARLSGAPSPRLSALPRTLLWLAGLGDPIVREMRETQYQFRKPFIMDSTAAARHFGIEPTPIEVGLKEMIAAPRVTVAR